MSLDVKEFPKDLEDFALLGQCIRLGLELCDQLEAPKHLDQPELLEVQLYTKLNELSVTVWRRAKRE